MHQVEVKQILSAQNGINLYRGCQHGCIYCDSRSKCYQMNHDFEDIEVKSNAILLLENALKRKRTKCMIGTGAMTDPYIPIERKLQYTRRSLELIERYGFGLAIQTKSDDILRDIDLLKKIHAKAKCVVQMTLTTYDETLCKILEPVICFGFGLTLREGNREYFYQQLDQYFPGMKEKYIHMYGNAYEVNSPNNRELYTIFRKICNDHQIVCDNEALFQYMHTYECHQYEQLSFNF